jgi:aminoglycoside phosphotransferase (APT) family kinase protein
MIEQRVRDYLSARLSAPDLSVAGLYRIPGGASRETWSVDATWRENGADISRAFIFRRDPDASVLVTERDIEFRVMDAVFRYGVPVPRMHWLETGTESLDRPFFVMERIEGCETSPSKVLLDPRFFPNRERLARQFVEILAGIHAIDWKADELDFLEAPKSEGECSLAEIEKWEAIVDRDTLEPQPVLRAAFRWLRNHLPPPAERMVLVHADYRTGNFLATPDGEIKGILDWEMTHLGDPMEDVGWACMRPWRWLGDEQIGGLMTRERFYEWYESTSGLQVRKEAVRFWEVLGNVKLAAIFVTGARSFCDSRTRSPMMAFLGRNIGRLELEVMDLMGV